MNLLIINLDKGIFSPGSASLERLKEYSQLVNKIFVVVWTIKKEKPIIFEDKLFIYPTNSCCRIFYFFDTLKIFRDIKKDNKIDLIFTQDPFETGFIGWLIAGIDGITLQLQIHTDFLSPHFKKESIHNRLRVMTAKFLIPKANCLRVVSERIKKSILRVTRYPLRVTTLPIFVDIEKIQRAPIKTNLRDKYPRFNFIILMAGRLTREKNIKLAIETVREIDDKKIGLIIVGEGPKKEESSDNIIFEPWTSDLVSYYKTADLFLLTSNYEGYGMVLAEAAAAGCKIISSDVGIAGEILEPENIFAVGDKNDLKNKIIKAIKGEIKSSKPLKLQTKEEYLKNYKQSWETCAS